MTTLTKDAHFKRAMKAMGNFQRHLAGCISVEPSALKISVDVIGLDRAEFRSRLREVAITKVTAAEFPLMQPGAE